MSSTAWFASPGEQPPVGIDLGTTYSLIAHLDATGRPVTIPNSTGDLLTPSAVFVDEDDVIVGKEAVKSSALSPDCYAECFKRDIGSLNFHRKVRRFDVPPEVLSAFILDRLRRDAERRIGPVRKAVITVPAFFDEGRRHATQEAGRLAGLEVLDIINEPTAAAVSYGYTRGLFDPSRTSSEWRERILVYDLGGGTFDVTLLEIEGTRFRAVATDGDVRLGGKDFDERLVNHLAEKFREAHGIDPRSDPQDAAQLWLDAQEAKHTLSMRSRATVVCFHAGIRMRIDVTREEFEDLIRDLVERTETTTSLAIRQLGLEWSQIDRVLLVGGSSRVPMVSDMLRRMTGKDPDCSQSPDEAVAHGAALYAGMLMAKVSPAGPGERRLAGPSCDLVNVNSHSLGVVGIHPKTKLRTNIVLIPRNTPLPAHAVRVFTTARQNQRSVRVPVVEGESERPEDCIALGECIVRDLPPGLPQGASIEVEYLYAANGRISVMARVPSVRYSEQVEIQRDHTRNLDDLPMWRARILGREPPVPLPSAAVPPPLPDGAPADRPTLLKRLDAVYTRVGQVVVSLPLPPPLVRSQEAARAVAAELKRLHAAWKEAERARHACGGGPDALRLDAALSQARDECHQAETRCQFAYLVLGRECAGAAFCPPGTEREIEEIRQLQARLKG